MQPRAHALIAEGRTGTTFLGACLDSHPAVKRYAEILLEEPEPGDFTFLFYQQQLARTRPDRMARESRSRLFMHFLREVALTQPDAIRSVIVDVKYGQTDAVAGFWSILAKMGFHLVHLVRANLLKTLISCRLNQMQGALGRRSHGVHRVPVHCISLPAGDSLLAELQARFDDILLARTRVREHRHEAVEIFYERFFEGDRPGDSLSRAFGDELCDFLRVAPRRLSCRLRKTNPHRLADVLANHEEVRESLMGTAFEFLLLENDRELLDAWHDAMPAPSPAPPVAPILQSRPSRSAEGAHSVIV